MTTDTDTRIDLAVIYERAEALIREHGWWQDYGNGLNGEICLAVALDCATRKLGQTKRFTAACEKLRELAELPDRDSLVRWNDAEERCVDDVYSLLQRARA